MHTAHIIVFLIAFSAALFGGLVSFASEKKRLRTDLSRERERRQRAEKLTETAIAEARRDVAVAQEGLAHEREHLREALNDAIRARAAADEKLDALEKQLEATRKFLTEARQETSEAYKDVDDLKAELTKSQEELGKSGEEQVKLRREHQQTVAELQEQLSAAKARETEHMELLKKDRVLLDGAELELKAAQEEARKTREGNTFLRAELEAAQKERDALRAELHAAHDAEAQRREDAARAEEDAFRILRSYSPEQAYGMTEMEESHGTEG